MLGERGHRVVVLEAAHAPGGQVLLAASSPRRRDLAGIVDWRVTEAKYSGVEFRYGVYAGADDVLALDPDLVVVATGGLPNRSFLHEGQDLVLDSWDVMSGDRPPARRRAGLRRQRRRAGPGRRRTARPWRGAASSSSRRNACSRRGVGSMNSPAYLQAFAETGVAVTLAARLTRVRRGADGRLLARLESDYADVVARTHRRRRRRRARHAAQRRAVLRAARREHEPRRGRPAGVARGVRAAAGAQPRRALPAVPHRRRRQQPQHPRRDLRRAAPVRHHLIRPTAKYVRTPR